MAQEDRLSLLSETNRSRSNSNVGIRSPVSSPPVDSIWQKIRSEAPAQQDRIRLDLGLCKKNSLWTDGLHFQVILLPRSKDKQLLEQSLSLSREDSASKLVGKHLHYQRYCIMEGGRYDSAIVEHRLPAQWSSPAVVAVNISFNVDKLASFLCHSRSWALHNSKPFASMDRVRTSSCPELLICSGSSADPLQGLVDRLLVAFHLWSRGIRAEYLRQDMWGTKGATHDAHSIEEASLVCVGMGIPFLVIVKAHTLKEKQSVKVRSIFEAVPDALVPLSSLAKYILDLLSHPRSDLTTPQCPPSDSSSRGLLPHTPSNHSGHHSLANTTIDIQLTCVDKTFGGDKKKAFKDYSALERKVKSLLDGFMGTGSTGLGSSSSSSQPVKVFAVDLPFAILREVATIYMLRGKDSSEMSDVLGCYVTYKRSLKQLVDLLDIEGNDSTPKGAGLRKANFNAFSSGSANKSIFLFSIPDECFDTIPVQQLSNAGRKTGASGAKAFSSRQGNSGIQRGRS